MLDRVALGGFFLAGNGLDLLCQTPGSLVSQRGLVVRRVHSIFLHCLRGSYLLPGLQLRLFGDRLGILAGANSGLLFRVAPQSKSRLVVDHHRLVSLQISSFGRLLSWKRLLRGLLFQLRLL